MTSSVEEDGGGGGRGGVVGPKIASDIGGWGDQFFAPFLRKSDRGEEID